MMQFSQTYIANKVTHRLNKSGIAANSLDKFISKSKEELAAAEHARNTNNFFKTSKDHNLERVRQRSKFMESLIEKNLDKFVPTEENGKSQYYEKYVR